MDLKLDLTVGFLKGKEPGISCFASFIARKESLQSQRSQCRQRSCHQERWLRAWRSGVNPSCLDTASWTTDANSSITELSRPPNGESLPLAVCVPGCVHQALAVARVGCLIQREASVRGARLPRELSLYFLLDFLMYCLFFLLTGSFAAVVIFSIH